MCVSWQVLYCLHPQLNGWNAPDVALNTSLKNTPRRGSEIFQKWGGGACFGEKKLKKKCLLIHMSMREHIKTRQTCNSFSLLPFQDDCLLFFCFVLLLSLFFKFERGVATPVTPLLDPPMKPYLKWIWTSRIELCLGKYLVTFPVVILRDK